MATKKKSSTAGLDDRIRRFEVAANAGDLQGVVDATEGIEKYVRTMADLFYQSNNDHHGGSGADAIRRLLEAGVVTTSVALLTQHSKLPDLVHSICFQMMRLAGNAPEPVVADRSERLQRHLAAIATNLPTADPDVARALSCCLVIASLTCVGDDEAALQDVRARALELHKTIDAIEGATGEWIDDARGYILSALKPPSCAKRSVTPDEFAIAVASLRGMLHKKGADAHEVQCCLSSMLTAEQARALVLDLRVQLTERLLASTSDLVRVATTGEQLANLLDKMPGLQPIVGPDDCAAVLLHALPDDALRILLDGLARTTAHAFAALGTLKLACIVHDLCTALGAMAAHVIEQRGCEVDALVERMLATQGDAALTTAVLNCLARLERCSVDETDVRASVARALTSALAWMSGATADHLRTSDRLLAYDDAQRAAFVYTTVGKLALVANNMFRTRAARSSALASACLDDMRANLVRLLKPCACAIARNTRAIEQRNQTQNHASVQTCEFARSVLLQQLTGKTPQATTLVLEALRHACSFCPCADDGGGGEMTRGLVVGVLECVGLTLRDRATAPTLAVVAQLLDVARHSTVWRAVVGAPLGARAVLQVAALSLELLVAVADDAAFRTVIMTVVVAAKCMLDAELPLEDAACDDARLSIVRAAGQTVRRLVMDDDGFPAEAHGPVMQMVARVMATAGVATFHGLLLDRCRSADPDREYRVLVDCLAEHRRATMAALAAGDDGPLGSMLADACLRVASRALKETRGLPPPRKGTRAFEAVAALCSQLVPPILASASARRVQLQEVHECVMHLDALVAALPDVVRVCLEAGAPALLASPADHDLQPLVDAVVETHVRAGGRRDCYRAGQVCNVMAALRVPGCHNPRCTGASPNAPLLCRGCLQVRYCSEACARQAWTDGHGASCENVGEKRMGSISE